MYGGGTISKIVKAMKCIKGLNKGLFRLISLALVLAVVITSAGSGIVHAAPGWYDPDWSYRRQVTIDHTEVTDVDDPSTTYADFPLLVYATGLSNIRADGADIRFTSSDGITELPREIESYSGGTLYAWVKVNLTKDSGDSTDDVIYMYYGNAAATEPAPDSTYGTQNVWDSNYNMVQHMNDADFNDSTMNNNDGTDDGTSDTSGQLGQARSFDGINDSVSWSSTSFNFDYDDAFVFHYWQKTAVGGDYPLAKGDTNKGYCAKTQGDGDIDVFMDVDGAPRELKRRVNAGAGDNSWHHVVITYDGSRDVSGLRVYVDGSEPTTQATANTVNAGDSMATTLNFYLGRNSGDTAAWYNGALDEVRISSIARSADWIATEYNNQNSPGTFCIVGSEEEVDTTPPTVTNVTSAKADGIYTTGEVIDITITFSEAVTVTGSPYLELETGDTDRNAAYQSGTGTTTLTFRYTAQAGDTSDDLDYKATNSLKLDGGTIKDAAGNDATLTLAAPGQANSLGANKALVIDANAPDIASVTTPADGATYNSASMPITFSGQVGDDANGAGMDANSATFYIKKGSEYWNGTSWTTITWLATTHAATTDGSEVAWTDAITLPSWTDGQTYEVKAKTTDKAGNTFEGTAVTFTYDTTAPTITSGTVADDNSYIDVAFSEGVYNTDGGSGALETTDFSWTFTQGSGTATNVTIASLKTTGGEDLSGGESTIRVILTVTGTPNGQETIEVKPAADSIYDKAGNAASTTTTTGAKNLNVTSVLPGDANSDGNINALDITKVERIITGLDTETPGADANQDGNINALDITKVELIITGLG